VGRQWSKHSKTNIGGIFECCGAVEVQFNAVLSKGFGKSIIIANKLHIY